MDKKMDKKMEDEHEYHLDGFMYMRDFNYGIYCDAWCLVNHPHGGNERYRQDWYERAVNAGIVFC
ncbi:MAG: hypothetical protein P4L79_10075 [Legionella sp.]|uniref:hypothetical protein n=1 Tax=Legionella sp. TaxID=459 RepID=UPI0028484366|nr:hypothetical protein [Legionella sp.]